MALRPVVLIVKIAFVFPYEVLGPVFERRSGFFYAWLWKLKLTFLIGFFSKSVQMHFASQARSTFR